MPRDGSEQAPDLSLVSGVSTVAIGCSQSDTMDREKEKGKERGALLVS